MLFVLQWFQTSNCLWFCHKLKKKIVIFSILLIYKGVFTYLQDVKSSHLSQPYDAWMQHQQAIKVLCKLDPIIFWCNANDIFFLHIILVHSLAHHFLRILFWSMVKQIIVCAYFSFALQIRDFLCIYSIVSASHDCIFNCTYSIV